jgi:hypothetical protein
MLRDFDLALFQQRLEVADAKGAMRQEMENPQTRLVAKALINLDQIHGSILS